MGPCITKFKISDKGTGGLGTGSYLEGVGSFGEKEKYWERGSRG